MSRLRSRPNEMNARARFDLLSRVMVAAFTFAFLQADFLILDPFLLVYEASFALPKSTDPRGQKPAGDDSTEKSETEFPEEKCAQSISNCAAYDGIADHDPKKMHSANDQKPPETASILADELGVGAHRFEQCFIMERQRDLNRTKGNDQTAHKHPRNGQVIKDARNIGEVGKDERQSDDQRAYCNDNAGPFQNITEAPHGEAEEFSFFKANAFYPRQTDCDEIHLDINSQEIFENKCARVHCSRDKQPPTSQDHTLSLHYARST